MGWSEMSNKKTNQKLPNLVGQQGATPPITKISDYTKVYENERLVLT